ncbi:unnamed protein product, partial [Closterium sp. NIES-53]
PCAALPCPARFPSARAPPCLPCTAMPVARRHARRHTRHARRHAVRDHFLAIDPTDLTVDLLEEHLLAAETSIVTVGAARGTPRTPFFEGCPPSPLAPSYASAAAVDILGTEEVGAAYAPSGKRRSGKGKGGKSGGGGSGGGGGGGRGGSGGGGGGSGSGGGSGGSVMAVVAAVGVVVAVVAAVGVVAAAVVAAVVVAVGVELFRGEVLAVARGSSSSVVGARPLRPSTFVSGLLTVGRLGVVFAARIVGATLRFAFGLLSVRVHACVHGMV